VLRKWERFPERVAPEVVAEVFAVLDQPDRPSDALARRTCVLFHGDLWLVNIGLEPREVTPLA